MRSSNTLNMSVIRATENELQIFLLLQPSTLPVSLLPAELLPLLHPAVAQSYSEHHQSGARKGDGRIPGWNHYPAPPTTKKEVTMAKKWVRQCRTEVEYGRFTGQEEFKFHQKLLKVNASKEAHTSILSLSMMVLRRWAMVSTVHSLNLSRMVFWISSSVL